MGQNIGLHLLVACAAVLLLPLSLCAQKIKPDPDHRPGKFGDTYVDYVGRFGEFFKLQDDWQISPSMQGNIEVIRIEGIA
jgi:hypothetical protein